MATIVAVPKTIREKLGEDGSEDFVQFLNVFMDLKRQEIIREESHEHEKLELNFERKLAETESRLSNTIERSKADIIKWMFIFWTGIVITILGGLFGFLKLFLGK